MMNETKLVGVRGAAMSSRAQAQAPMMTPEEEEFEAVAEAQVGTSREMPCTWSLVRVRTT